MTLDTRAQDKQANKQTKERDRHASLSESSAGRTSHVRTEEAAVKKNTTAPFSKRFGQRPLMMWTWALIITGTWRDFKTTVVTGWDFGVTNSHPMWLAPSSFYVTRQRDLLFCQTFSLVEGKKHTDTVFIHVGHFCLEVGTFLRLPGADTLSYMKALVSRFSLSQEVWQEGRGSLEENEKVGGLGVCNTSLLDRSEDGGLWDVGTVNRKLNWARDSRDRKCSQSDTRFIISNNSQLLFTVSRRKRRRNALHLFLFFLFCFFKWIVSVLVSSLQVCVLSVLSTPTRRWNFTQHKWSDFIASMSKILQQNQTMVPCPLVGVLQQWMFAGRTD